MNTAPIFLILKANAAVTALLGVKPLRVYPWGDAPERQVKPYATYGTFSGTPENYVDKTPDIDSLGTQIDIWADTVQSCEAVFAAIRDALEPHAHITNFQGSVRDTETNLYNARLELDFWQPR